MEGKEEGENKEDTGLSLEQPQRSKMGRAESGQRRLTASSENAANRNPR